MPADIEVTTLPGITFMIHCPHIPYPPIIQPPYVSKAKELQRQIATNTDSCIVWANPTAWNITVDNYWGIIGYYHGYAFAHGCGLRYQNITIPKGSKILGANLIETAGPTNNNAIVNSKIRAEDSSNPLPFSTL
ncbi:unnamed protein product, partial [marine sediment metagenome]